MEPVYQKTGPAPSNPSGNEEVMILSSKLHEFMVKTGVSVVSVFDREIIQPDVTFGSSWRRELVHLRQGCLYRPLDSDRLGTSQISEKQI